jgi:hypothetical protein
MGSSTIGAYSVRQNGDVASSTAARYRNPRRIFASARF